MSISPITNMLGPSSIEQALKRLSADTDLPSRVETILLLRDHLDSIYTSPTYPTFIHTLIPVLEKILESPCYFSTHAPEQNLRHHALEVLQRICTAPAPTPPLEPFTVHIIKLLVDVIQHDNEDNAILALKMASDLVRHPPQPLNTQVLALLQVIRQGFDAIPAAVASQLDSPTPDSNESVLFSRRQASPVATAEMMTDQTQNKPLQKALQSFTFFSELPVAAVAVVSSHKDLATTLAPQLVASVTRVVLLEAQVQKHARQEAVAHGSRLVGMSPNIQDPTTYGNFISAQAKAMSLVAYLQRQYPNHLKDFLPKVPAILVRLLQDCPRSKSSARKELITAFRHLVNFDVRELFQPYICELLEEQTLIGDGLAAHDSCRVLAYSALADLIHHVRSQLTPAQVSKAVEVYTKNVHVLGSSFHTMSAKLLLNLAEPIALMESKEDASFLLMLILDAIGNKFAVMNEHYHSAVKVSQRNNKAIVGSFESHVADKADPPSWNESDIFTSGTIKSNTRDLSSDPVSDNKFLLKNLMTGLRAAFYQLKSCHGAPWDSSAIPASFQGLAYGFSAEQVSIIRKLFHQGARVFRYYHVEDKPQPETLGTSDAMSTLAMDKEEKELLESFATVFHSMDPAIFYEIFQAEIPRLYDMIFEHPALLYIPQFFLASESTSPTFCALLVNFLMTKLSDVDSTDPATPWIILRLFKLAFMAIDLFSVQNERILLPHVVGLITACIKLSATAREPCNYLQLLRSLFRSIGGGKFDAIYKLIQPSLHVILQTLNMLLLASRRQAERDLYVELCLTVPARLSHLTPHLGHLLRPLLAALHGTPELVGQGLRTLELCIDNLGPTYMENVLKPVLGELMEALYLHLRPHPYNHAHSHNTARVLSKLSGRTRRLDAGARPLNCCPHASEPSTIDIRLVGSKHDRAWSIEIGLDNATNLLMGVFRDPQFNQEQARRNDIFYKQQSLLLVKAHIKARIGIHVIPEKLSILVKLRVAKIAAQQSSSTPEPQSHNSSQSTVKYNHENSTLQRLIKALMHACTIPQLEQDASSFLTSLCSEFALLEVGRKDNSRLCTIQNSLVLDTRLFADTLLECLASDRPEVREVAKRTYQEFTEVIVTILGGFTNLRFMEVYRHMCSILVHACYSEDWFTKAGGIAGIRLLIDELRLSTTWLTDEQILKFARALMFVVKDMPNDLPHVTRHMALDTLDYLLSRITIGCTRENITTVPPVSSGQIQAASPSSPAVQSAASCPLSVVVAEPFRSDKPVPLVAQICRMFCLNLSHIHPLVRVTAKEGLDKIANATGVPVWQVTLPHKHELMQLIFSEPLENVVPDAQTSLLEACNYCLRLKPGYMVHDDKLEIFLQQALKIALSDDPSTQAKSSKVETTAIKLRIAYINILSTYLVVEEWVANAPASARTQKAKITSVFFKCLHSDQNEVIDASYEALRSFLRQSVKLPKDILQAGLRPILTNLQDPKRLTVQVLANLSRLLRLLTTYFKVEIGQRLLDHCNILTEPQILHNASFSVFELEAIPKLIAAVFDILPLLPEAAEQFKERLIDKLLDIEVRLRQARVVSLRSSVYVFLNKYAKTVWPYLTGKLYNEGGGIGPNSLQYGRLLAEALEDPSSHALRIEATTHIATFVSGCTALVDSNSPHRFVATIGMLHVVSSLCPYADADAWMQHEGVLSRVFEMGKRLTADLDAQHVPVGLRLAALKAGENLLDIFVQSLRQSPTFFDGLLSLVNAITTHQLKPTPSLFSYIYRTIVCNPSINFWKNVIYKCLNVYAAQDVSQDAKAWLFHHIVNPIISMNIARYWAKSKPHQQLELLDRELINTISSVLWQQELPDPKDDLLNPRIDHTRLEVLQLSATLVKYYPNLLEDVRKDIMKFAYGLVRLDDNVVRNSAYVLIAYFIAQFETPAKIVSHVYHTLLKWHQPDCKALVAQALDLIVPAVAARCGDVIWIMPRRIIQEDVNNTLQAVAILHLLVRHVDKFYASRDKYALWAVTWLRRVAPVNSGSLENKKLAFHIVSMIWEWTRRQVHELPEQDNDTRASEHVLSSSGRHTVIKFLVEFIAAQSGERYPLPSTEPSKVATNPAALATRSTPGVEFCQQWMTLLYNFLQPQYWGVEHVDLFPKVTDFFLCSAKATVILNPASQEREDGQDAKYLTCIINTLQAIRIILHFQSDEWVLKHITHIQNTLAKCLRSENAEVQDCLHFADALYDGGRPTRSIIGRLLDALPNPISSDSDQDDDDDDNEDKSEGKSSNHSFITFLSSVASEALAAGNLTSAINIIWSLSHRKPAAVGQHVPALLKAMQGKLSQDHLAHYTQLSNAVTQSTVSGRAVDAHLIKALTAPPFHVEMQARLIWKAIEALASRMETLGENRRDFLAVVASIAAKSLHNHLCQQILDMVKDWVLSPQGTWPGLKEKTAVLNKMLAFEGRQDLDMYNRLLSLVIQLYENASTSRTEYTARLEPAFLSGTRATDVDMRNRFLAVFDKSLVRTASGRLDYVLATQNWGMIGESFWVTQASHLLLGAVELNNNARLHQDDFRLAAVSQLFHPQLDFDTSTPLPIGDDRLEVIIANHRQFVAEATDVRVRDFLLPLSHLQHCSKDLAYKVWTNLFPIFWAATPRDHRTQLQKALTKLICKEHHMLQLDKRPNVVQALLDGVAKAWPECELPYHVVKFQAKQFGAWYIGTYLLEKQALDLRKNVAPALRESRCDALVELYSLLQDDDMFYGTWRRRCSYPETNTALSCEQMGMWDKAQRMYEEAQIKARRGVLHFSEQEQTLWEDQWIVCGQRLMQWDILQDLSKHENMQDLLLECVWRNTDSMWLNQATRDQADSIIKGLMDAPTPRRAFFQAFLALLKYHEATDKSSALPLLTKSCDTAMQLCLRKWYQLPTQFTNAHVGVLQNMQIITELQDASIICNSLAATNAANLDTKSNELKGHLAAWRDRLPNDWEDILAWQDLVTWRQHVFGLINSVYLGLGPPSGQSQNAPGSSFAYRGYHETAWIINRFAHVARKHNLTDVCINQLSRIYTLPNIEIQEAFLKLREQAKCHFGRSDDLNNGLDVINNTNMNFFTDPQKAAFYTLKGIFLDRMNNKEEARGAFGEALNYNLEAPKAWAEWAHFNDRQFKERPDEPTIGRDAVLCYLQASGCYKSAKSRRCIARTIWLLTCDDINGIISSAFDDYTGDLPVWYWLTFIPQLLTGLNSRESRKLHEVLRLIAKNYPQALFFQLRTTREDMVSIRQHKEQQTQRQVPPSSTQGQPPDSSSPAANQQHLQPKESIIGPSFGAETGAPHPSSSSIVASGSLEPGSGANHTDRSGEQRVPHAQSKPARPWELTDNLMAYLKTTWPVLATAMEMMIDQIVQVNHKGQDGFADQESYRLIVALVLDVMHHINRFPEAFSSAAQLPHNTESNVSRFAQQVIPPALRPEFQADFVDNKPNMLEYVHRLRKWRDRFQFKLDSRPQAHLEELSPQLPEFRFHKYQEAIEVPGQYLEHTDKNSDFIKIDRFMSNVQQVRQFGSFHLRLNIRGNDGSVQFFALQNPAARHSRREERVTQLLRQLNQPLRRKIESRRRDLQFRLQRMIPLSPQMRLVQEYDQCLSLHDIYEHYAQENGFDKDEPALFMLKGLMELKSDVKVHQNNLEPITSGRLEIFAACRAKWTSSSMAMDYFQSTYQTYNDLHFFRRRFSYDFAGLSFMTYLLQMGQRAPHKLHISKTTGNVWGTDLVPSMAAQKPFVVNAEPVPFRLTPSLHMLMGPFMTEGLFAASMMAIARCLALPDLSELDHSLTLFVRDEVLFWISSTWRNSTGEITDLHLRVVVQSNNDAIARRAATLAKVPEGKLPATQTVIDQIAMAVDAKKLAEMDTSWMAYI